MISTSLATEDARDSSEKGWVGLKFYGYRVTYTYNGAAVKVDALPTSLVTFKTGQDAR